MNKRTITKTIASASLAIAVVGGIGTGTAGAQTREHILLARQVGVPATTTDTLGTADEDPTEARVNIRWEKLTVPFA